MPPTGPASRRSPRTFRFGPASAEPSSRLQLAAGYFLLTGGGGVLMILAALVVVRDRIELPWWQVAIGAGVNLAFCAGYLWTGRQLAARSKRGGKVALALLAIPLLNLLLGSPPTFLELFMMLVGGAVIASVWKELE